MNINDEIDMLDFKIPDFLIVYLYYGDRSGLTDNEVAIIDQWYDDNFTGLIGHIMPGDDLGFCHRHDLSKYGILACDCTEVVFVVIGHSSNE